jgi:hypothetical protein
MKVAISGTYSTGKTTTALALSYLTGIPNTHAKTMREILPSALPGKKLEEVSMPELVQLGIRRLINRCVAEDKFDEFISDGSSLHEWAYGLARTEIGLHPGKNELSDPKTMKIFKEVMQNFGAVAKDHALSNYDVFVHLPIEFPLKMDGHRPVSEEFRRQASDTLLEALESLKIPYIIVGGSVEERLLKIVNYYKLPRVMSIERAVDMAQKEISSFRLAKEESK